MQSFPVFIFYSVKREREKGGGRGGCKMFAKRLLGFTHVQRLALSNRLATVLRRLLGSFYIAVILYAAVFVSSPQFFTTNGLGRYVSKRLASLEIH